VVSIVCLAFGTLAQWPNEAFSQSLIRDTIIGWRATWHDFD
jgi:hypothetical protein